MNIVYQGINGSFSSQALNKLCEKYSIHATGVENPHFFKELFESISTDSLALIPVENSISGNVNQNNELFLQYDIKILAEVTLDIHHCLIQSQKNHSIYANRIQKDFTILSHPQALAQCSSFISTHTMKTIESQDTAGSVKYLKDNPNEKYYAIAPKLAAEIYDGVVIQENIENYGGNTTRFVLVKLRGEEYEFENRLPQKDKSTFIIELKDKVGSLYQVLKILYLEHINITRLISKPHPQKHFSYLFVFDVQVNLEDEMNAHILKKLQEESNYFKSLGSYPSWNK
jgi:prephenate dehydratase